MTKSTPIFKRNSFNSINGDLSLSFQESNEDSPNKVKED